MSLPPEGEQVLIVAPVGRDGPLLAATLQQAGFDCSCLQDAESLAARLVANAGALLLTEEALVPSLLERLQAALAVQPEWSNLPIVLLLNADAHLRVRGLLGSLLGPDKYVTILERPIPPRTFVEMIRAALWVRRRQYQVRALLDQLAVQNATLAREVVEREQAQWELRELNATLEQRVAERTAALEHSNRELGQFIYLASHDLRTPLRGIDQLAGFILQDADRILPPESREHLAKLRKRVKRMDTLLTDLLAYSHAGQSGHPPERVDVAVLARSVVDTLAVPPGFTVTLDEPLPIFYAQRTPFETVLRSLLDNAVKHHHNPAAGHVTLCAQDADGEFEFAVADDGPGIDPAYHERIFEAFQTLRPRDQVEGSGAGLAIVKRILESQGGTIWVDSRPSSGATFRFRWPKAPNGE
jgi:signal transduction histidine kinase